MTTATGHTCAVCGQKDCTTHAHDSHTHAHHDSHAHSGHSHDGACACSSHPGEGHSHDDSGGAQAEDDPEGPAGAHAQAACACGHDHAHDHDDAHGHDHGAGCACGTQDDGCGCGHDHDHSHDEPVTARSLALPLMGVVFFAAAFLPVFSGMRLWLYLAAYLLIGGPVLLDAGRAIAKGNFRNLFNESFLMSLATIGAFAIGEYAEGVAVMLFYRIGETLQSYALGKSRQRIRGLMALRPDKAMLLTDGKASPVDPADIQVGERILVRPGDRVALDGVVESGTTRMNTSAITGESVPRKAEPGTEVFAGFVNDGGVVTVKVTRPYGQSAIARILEMTENASAKKSRTEGFLTRFARIYTPVVVGLAVLLAFLPPLFGAITLYDSVYRALTFLVVSCPCALVLSVPLAFFGGIGAGSKRGILFKGSAYLEAMSKMDTIAFDKTGTLTKGVFTVAGIQSKQLPEQEFLRLAAHAECFSTHPIAKSIVSAYEARYGAVDQAGVAKADQIAGKGIQAEIGGKRVAIGNAALMTDCGVQAGEGPQGAVHMAVDGVYAGYLIVSDVVRPEAKEALAALKAEGVSQLVMLTGDAAPAAQAVAQEVGITSVHSALLPGDKAQILEGLLSDDQKTTTAFVGDGVNDAPVLARADVGIAMGGLGSEAAIEAADVVVMDDNLMRLGQAKRIARRTMRIATQNIVFALAIKAVIMVLGALNITGIWMAVFADVGVSLLAVLNSLRVLRVKN